MRFSIVFLDLCNFLKKTKNYASIKFQTGVITEENILNILNSERNNKD